METGFNGNGSGPEAGWVTRLANRDHTGAEYQELKFTIHRKLLDRINLEALSSLAGERARAEIRIAVAKLVDEERTPLSLAEKERVIEEVLDEVFGLGPLEPLLRDPTISDILVTTPKLVYIERGGKLYRTSVEFKDNTHLLRIIEKVVARVGRRVDESSPLVDARLPDGSRVNAAIPPVAVDGPLLSIRRFGKELLAGEDLVKKLALTEGMLELLKACVRARLNILISGGTGAGKTTLLNVLSSYIPENERIITIEDAAELRLRQTHVARMETRPANIEGHGAIKIRDLVINALRMRPDRIIVGEVRSEEALDMLQAMNTGHDGSLTTIHSNTPRDAVGRLEVLVGMANANMGVRSIRAQVTSAIDLMVQVARFSDGSRKITYVTELVGLEGEQVTMQDIFLFEKSGIAENGKVLGRFKATGVRPRFYEKLRSSGIQLPASSVPDRCGDRAIMNALVAFSFLVILALLLFSISFGLRFYEKQRRKRLVSMLRTVTENGEDRHVNLLVDSGDRKSGLDDVLGSVNVTDRIKKLLYESGLGWTPTRLLIMMSATFAVGALASLRVPVSTPPAVRALLLGLCAAFVPLYYVSAKRAKRLKALETLLPDALDFLARSMRAGHAFTISLEMVGEEIHEPLGPELRALFNEQNLGASLERSFASFSKRVPIPDIRFFCSAVLLQRQTGGNLSEILNRLSHIIRERFRLKGQVKAVSAHGRLTATILTLMPIATLVALMVTSPHYLDALLNSSIGRRIIAAGVVAQFLGNFFIRRIVKIKV